jgi:hypothetical protein
MKSIEYSAGYKYQLRDNYKINVPILGLDIDTDFIKLGSGGSLCICKGYAWDGPSGPTLDTKNFMRGSLVHDALYELMRKGFISREYRAMADELLREICLEDGMSRIRAWWVYVGVSKFAEFATLGSNIKKRLIAP